MIYLVFKISVFLILAIAFGVGIGFAFRNTTAKKQMAELAGVMHDTQARIPQLETALRSREQRVEKLKKDVEVWKQKIPALAAQLEERETTLRTRDKELHQLRQQGSAGAAEGVDVADLAAQPSNSEAIELVAQLTEELAVQREQFKKARELLAAEERNANELRERIQSANLAVQQVERQRDTAASENDTLRAERDRLQKSIEVIGEQLSHARAAKDEAVEQLRRTGKSESDPQPEVQTH